MAVDFSNTLVIGISSRALFDLEEENMIFHNKGIDEYRAFQLKNENNILKKGTAFHLVESLLKLNRFAEERLVEVIIMSRNSPDTGLRVLNSIQQYQLDISRAAFAGGNQLSPYLDAFNVDLFLTKDEKDVQAAIDAKACAAATIYGHPEDFEPDLDTLRIAFDADAVIFSEESEFIYKTQGLPSFHDHEQANANIPLLEGPFAKLLKILSKLQKQISQHTQKPPIRLAIVTARSGPAHERVIKTLREWDVYVDEAFFMGGITKDQVLKAFKAHIFFDDQEVHLEKASKVVPSSKVPYSTDSLLHKLDKKTKV